MDTAIATDHQAQFYREWLMARGKFDPRDFGVEMSRDEFQERMAEVFNTTFRGSLTIDELLLHPRDAMKFCDDVRHGNGWYDVPDDIILRAVLTRRKNP